MTLAYFFLKPKCINIIKTIMFILKTYKAVLAALARKAQTIGRSYWGKTNSEAIEYNNFIASAGASACGSWEKERENKMKTARDDDYMYVIFENEDEAENHEMEFIPHGWSWCSYGGYFNAFKHSLY